MLCGVRSLSTRALRDVVASKAGLLKAHAAAYESLLVDVSDGVATVTLNRPKKQNAMNMAVWEEMPHCFDLCRFGVTTARPEQAVQAEPVIFPPHQKCV